MASLNSIMDFIKSRQSFILCGHIMPDGDSLGSVLALGKVLKEMGKDVTMVSFDPVPDNFTFLPGIEHLIIGDKELDKNYDAFVVLDCSVPDRLGPYGRILDWDLTVINIDHHPGNSIPADYNYIDPGAAATGEILFDMLVQSNVNISPDVATCLYTAIITDTGSFKYENTTPATHRRVADLIECGIQPGKLNAMIYDEKPLPSLLLLRAALQTLKLSDCGRVAWITVLRRTLEEVSARDEHTESLINYPRSIKGVKIAILFRELKSGVFKVGFRSKGDVNVNELAAKFGGGGHAKASGCVLKGKIENIIREVVAAAVDEVRERDRS